MGFPGGASIKKKQNNPPADTGDLKDKGLISGRSSGRMHGNTFQYSCLENSHGQRSLMGYSPQSRKESDTTEACFVFSFVL